MRGIEALLLAGFIGLIGIGIWNVRQYLPELGPKAVNYASTDTNDSSGRLDGKGGKAAGLRGKRGRGSGVQGSARGDIAFGSFPISETEVDVPMPKFPIGADFRRGATGAQIRAQYGEPTARTTEMRGGHVFEHYYYFNADRTELTMATLENGVIVSAESTSQ